MALFMESIQSFYPKFYRYLKFTAPLRCDYCDQDDCLVSEDIVYHQCTMPLFVPRYLWHITYRGRDKSIGRFGLLRNRPLQDISCEFEQRQLFRAECAKKGKKNLYASDYPEWKVMYEGYVYAHITPANFLSLCPIYMDQYESNFRPGLYSIWRIDTYAFPYPWYRYKDPYFSEKEDWIYGNSVRTPNNIPFTALKKFRFGDIYETKTLKYFYEVYLKGNLDSVL